MRSLRLPSEGGAGGLELPSDSLEKVGHLAGLGA
jgi:hypothetical protein